MKIKPFTFVFPESENIISCFNNIEINQYNIDVFLNVYERNSIQLKNDNESLKKENELLKNKNDSLFNENYELKREKIVLEAEKGKLEYMISHSQNNFSKNESQSVKNSLNHSGITSNRDTTIGDNTEHNVFVNINLSKEDYQLKINKNNLNIKNPMALLETATAYILGIITENEEVKKFPTDFVSASMKWIRSWFLEDDPKAAAKLNDVSKSDDYKKAVIEGKLEGLEGNEVFQKELMEKLQAYSQHKITRKNMVENADIEADGNVWIGDEKSDSDNDYDEKNITKGSKIKAGKDFILGDRKNI